ncbi:MULTISPECIES: prepilin peptidase [Serratia]|uniref:Prepilin leader peptidase/N-methyltransferase n=1 Tax=Serratia fonticola TaxID=47917 RepID=A0AAP2B998_SERFO|nr:MULTISPECIES: A24 family peptidase [Serratia]ALX95857.1 prepilin peptidase [Serratia fonticola]MBC3210816.1 prepilin peptidase [Serratia fonticola]MBP0996801.1 prepilin peptidase [Serratia fonticola]MBP1001322.1 prepilin peptidase [Serratia fonticola]MBP1011502.1 prepilin peptidase [Serratia fonticola]
MSLLLDFTVAFPLLWLCVAGILGAIVGSFLNVVIYRLPVMLEKQWQREALVQLALPLPESTPRFDLLLPHSCCPHCQHPIAARDNIPLLSFLLLKGKARCCGERIPRRYPLVEVATAMMFVLTALIFPLGFPLLGAWILLSFLLTLAVIDHHRQLLPDVLTLPLLWIGLLFNIQGHFASLEQATIGAVAGYVCLWSVFWLFKLATGKEALGYGDFKLLAALGAWLGWQALPQVILVAAASGLLVTLIQRGLAKQDLNQPLAFGPWLAVSGAVNMFIPWSF